MRLCQVARAPAVLVVWAVPVLIVSVDLAAFVGFASGTVAGVV